MNRAATIALSPFGLLYGAVMKTRAALYARRVFRAEQVSVPVISVGNITTGGTGKTPLVEWVANKLAARGLRVCVLTRGYGRENSNQRVVVSDGSRILTDVESAGDEPFMLAESLLGKAAVVCDNDRVAAAQWAIEHLKSDVLILDDGFQHLRLRRDMDIVTIDGTQPFDNGWTLPAGMLREPISSLARADCIVLTRSGDNDNEDLNRQIQTVSDAPILASHTITSRWRSLQSDSPVEITKLRETRVAAFCGLGNPASFFHQLSVEGIQAVHTVAFRDHQRYTQSDIDRLTKESAARGAEALVTTAKDAVKLRLLRFDLPCYVMEIEVQIAGEEILLRLIDKAIARANK